MGGRQKSVLLEEIFKRSGSEKKESSPKKEKKE